MTTPPRSMRSRRSMRGFTLIEVMVSVLIFSLGLLGTAALQARAVQMSTQNGDRSRAAILANQMVSDMWAEQSITPTTIPAWTTRVSDPAVSGLPSGVGAVGPGAAASSAVITITWKAPSATAAANRNSFTTTVVIQ